MRLSIRQAAGAVLIAGLGASTASAAPVDALRAGDMGQMIEEVIAVYEDAGLSWDFGIEWMVGPYTTTYWFYNPNEDEVHVGAVPADAVMHARPQGRGLVRLEETGAGPWPLEPAEIEASARISAHEFHYARLENVPPETVFAYRVLRGDGIDGRHDGIVIGNLLASFCHLRDTAVDRWAARFVAFVRSCSKAERTPTRESARRRFF